MKGAPTASIPDPASPEPGLVARLVRGVAVEVAGFGGAQVIRLAANLVLARLLFPEAFGLMALLQVVMYGLYMLTDVGLHQTSPPSG